MKQRIIRDLQKLQRLAGLRKKTIEDVVWKVIHDDDQRLIEVAIEYCHRLYGPPAAAEVYVSQDGIETYRRLSGGLDKLAGLYWHIFAPPDDIFAKQVYLAASETQNLCPLTFKEYEKMDAYF